MITALILLTTLTAVPEPGFPSLPERPIPGNGFTIQRQLDRSLEARSLVDAKRPALEDLAASAIKKHEDGGLQVNFWDNGRLSYIGGGQFAHGCAVEELTMENGVGVADCAFANLAPLLKFRGSPFRSQWKLDHVDTDPDGLQILILRQVVEDIEVRQSKTTLTFFQGGLMQYAGRVFNENEVPVELPPQAARAAIRGPAEAAAGASLGPRLSRNRFWDAEKGEVVSEVIYDFDDRVVYEVGESSGTLHASGQKSLHYDTNRYVWVENYSSDYESTSDSWKSAEFNLSCPGAYGWYYYDWDSSDQRFGPRLINEPFSSGTYYTYDSCNDSYLYLHSVQNAYYWMRDIGDSYRNWRSAYGDWYSYVDPEELDVIVKANAYSECGNKPACTWYSWNGSYYYIYIDDGSVGNLKTMAHEMGHVLHLFYDLEGTIGSVQGGATMEGAAYSAINRYQFHRYWYDGVLFSYDDVEYKQFDSFQRGRLYPGGNNSFNSIYNTASGGACNSSTGDAHLCGEFMAIPLGEAGQNYCRAPYSTCTDGEKIITDGNYGTSPERPMFVAYTYAMKTAPYNATPYDFFNYVSSRLSAFLNNGYDLGYSSGTRSDAYWNLHSIMNSHCVGWSHHCDDYWKDINGALPRKRLTSGSLSVFDDQPGGGYRQMAIDVEDMSVYGGSRHTLGTTDGAKYVRLDPGEYAATTVCFPQTGYYSYEIGGIFHYYDNVIISVTGSSSQIGYLYTYSSNSYWDWEEVPGSMYVTAGCKTLELHPGSGDIVGLDTLVIINDTP